ncbi:MAG: hypothetical protein K0R73_567 [Candidatus Midichloriaceae bacterium]|jgi:hypothetical protein|nr:hypothetical protein [Candidatus Midichloriaceae bacterium]
MKPFITTLLSVLILIISNTYSFANEGNLNFKTISVPPSVKDPATYKKTASTLLISCVDFRLRDETEALMEKIGLLDSYDEIVMPGASLAVMSEKHKHWAETTKDIIGLLKDLHNIKQIILLDHKDCGAFKVVYGAKKVETDEICLHKSVMAAAAKKIQKSFPDLKVYTLIMGLDGTVENITDDLL